MIPRRTALAIAVAASVLVLGACGGGAPPARGDGKSAAEPATSPPLSTKPAGRVVTLAPGPQGIVYDARTRSLAVAVRAPYRLLVLDPTTLATRFSVPLPGQVRHLQVSATGGTVLVPSETANALLEVDLTTGRASSVRVQRHPHDAAGTPGGDVLVGNEFSGSLSVVRSGRVIHTFTDLRQPGGVIAAGNTAVAVDVGEYTVSTYDLATMTRVARIGAGRGPTHVALVAPGTVLVADTRGDQVLLDRLSPLHQVGALSLPGGPYGVAGDPTTRTVWVTLTGRNELVGLDVSGTTPRVVATYPTVEQPDTVTVSPGSHTLWVTGTKAGVVQRITR